MYIAMYKINNTLQNLRMCNPLLYYTPQISVSAKHILLVVWVQRGNPRLIIKYYDICLLNQLTVLSNKCTILNFSTDLLPRSPMLTICSSYQSQQSSGNKANFNCNSYNLPIYWEIHHDPRLVLCSKPLVFLCLRIQVRCVCMYPCWSFFLCFTLRNCLSSFVCSLILGIKWWMNIKLKIEQNRTGIKV